MTTNPIASNLSETTSLLDAQEEGEESWLEIEEKTNSYIQSLLGVGWSAVSYCGNTVKSLGEKAVENPVKTAGALLLGAGATTTGAGAILSVAAATNSVAYSVGAYIATSGTLLMLGDQLYVRCLSSKEKEE